MYNLKDSFLELKEISNNFKIINPEMLHKPNSIIILRLVCNLTHHKLTEIYKRDFGKVLRFNPYEMGKIKVGKKVGPRLAEIFRKNLPESVVFEKIEEKFLAIRERTKLTHGIGRLLEEKVNRLMMKEKLTFQRNVSIKGKSGIPIDVDFIIPSRTNPKVAIECKVSRSFAGSFGNWYAKSMIVNAVELLPKKIRFVVVIDGNWTKNSIKLMGNYCTVIQVDELDNLKQVIMEFL